MCNHGVSPPVQMAVFVLIRCSDPCIWDLTVHLSMTLKFHTFHLEPYIHHGSLKWMSGRPKIDDDKFKFFNRCMYNHTLNLRYMATHTEFSAGA